MSPAHRHNAALAYAPAWSHPLVGSLFPDPNDPDGVRFDVPTIFDELEAAPALDTWPIPQLGVTGKHKPKPAFLFLHVFSTGTKRAREKREVIRRHSVVEMLDPSWRGLVEMRFVLGKGDHRSANSTEESDDDWREREEEEKAIEMEQAEYGDLIRLEGLLGGYNMNQGKSWDWIRWVGKESEREAQWVFKCDDDVSLGVGESERRCRAKEARWFEGMGERQRRRRRIFGTERAREPWRWSEASA